MSLDKIKFRFYAKYSCDGCGADMNVGIEGRYEDLPSYVEHYEKMEDIACAVCAMLRQGEGRAKFMGFMSHSEYEQAQEELEKELLEEGDLWEDEEDM